MRVFVAGGTGFVGRHILEKLHADGASLRLLVRKGSEKKIPQKLREKVEIVEGDPFDEGLLREGMKGCDAVVNAIGIIRDFPKKGITFEKVHFEVVLNLADAARKNGIKRFVQVSALGADWDERTEYFRSKWKADQYLIDHDFGYTIFRPSVIFGDGDGFVSTLARLVKMTPIIPVIGDGRYPLQPVFIGDLAAAVSKSIVEEKGVFRVYTAAGPEVYAFEGVLAVIARAMGKRRVVLHLPAGLVVPVVSRLERFSFFPVTYDQLYMLFKGSVGDNRAFVEDFGLKLTSLSAYLEKRFARG